jgi:hypothetical protein
VLAAFDQSSLRLASPCHSIALSPVFLRPHRLPSPRHAHSRAFPPQVRINVVDPQTLDVVHADTRAYSEQSATIWSGAMDELIETIPSSVKSKIGRVSVSGTSASVLTSSADVAAKRGPRMYDFSVTQTVCNETQNNGTQTLSPSLSLSLSLSLSSSPSPSPSDLNL